MERTTRTAFGTRLVQSRKRARLTQEALAKLVGVAQCTISEAERKALSGLNTVQIARVLGVNALWLATGEGSWDDGQGGEGAGLDPLVPTLKAEGSGGQAEQDGVSLSPLAQEIGVMFDLLLSDRLLRSQGYNLATQLFLDLRSGRHAEGGAATAAELPDTPAVSPRAYPQTQHT